MVNCDTQTHIMSSSLKRQICRELNEWKSKRRDLFEGEDAWIQDLQFDMDQLLISMKVDYDFTFTYPTVSIIIPDQFPDRATCISVSYDDYFKEYPQRNLIQVLEALIAHFEEKRNKAIEDISPVDDNRNTLTDLLTPNTAVSEPEDIIFEIEDTEKVNITDMIERDLEQFNNVNGYRGSYRASNIGEIRIYLCFDPTEKLDISDMVASAWGINLKKYICISLTFNSYYLESDNIPSIDAYQCGDLSTSNLLDGQVKFGLYWTVQEMLKTKFFKIYWPHSKYEQLQARTGKNYMIAVMEKAIEAIKSSPQLCMICGQQLPYAGLKPTVCDSPLCVFSHEEYGLGVDLESVIKESPEVVDLAITMTYAAAKANKTRYDPFEPFPMGLQATLKDGSKATFLTPDNKRNHEKVREVLEKIPSLTILTSWIDKGILKDSCDELDPLLYPLLRWILASNRSHLKKLDPEEQITGMQTNHQYVMLSSPPAREKQFQELKSLYGSVYAFHGSALGNWHSIMRQGLKNMSGTPAMVNGAAYGNGVYLAPDSGTSFGYMRYESGWKNSMFKSSDLGCMAICEIIKHPCLSGQPKPYYVVANESLLATRYFMLFTTHTNAYVDGATLKPPPLKLAYGITKKTANKFSLKKR